MATIDAPDIEEQYISAGDSSNLRVEADRRSDADILIAAAGSPRIITADMVSPGVVVVDVGTNSVDGKLVGDVHPAVGEVASWLSPVPGGVGPMTITMLLANTLAAAAEHLDG